MLHYAMQVPDCDFFVNKRDYPQIKFHQTSTDKDGFADGYAVEPYGFIFDKDDTREEDDTQLSRHAYSTYAPILYVQYVLKTERWINSCERITSLSFFLSLFLSLALSLSQVLLFIR